MYKTTKEENLIMKDIDKNYQDMSWNELLDMKKKAKKLASNYFKKKTISIRINENNLEKIKW